MVRTEEEAKGKRLGRFRSVLDKALAESSKLIDSRAAVLECYGEDASIFADSSCDDGDSTDMLANLIDDAMERTNERLEKEFGVMLEKNEMKNHLMILDQVIDDHAREDREKKEAEEYDQHSSRLAISRSKLPEKVTVTDALAYHRYNIMVANQNKLDANLACIKSENEDILHQLKIEKDNIKMQLSRMKEEEKLLKKSADRLS